MPQMASYTADDRFNDLPLYIKEKLTCLCPKEKAKLVRVPIIRYGNGNLQHAMFCMLCFKPQRYFVQMVVQTCEECEKYYVPDEFPVGKWRLCAECDGRSSFTRSPVSSLSD